jgi:vitamin B12 transporter
MLSTLRRVAAVVAARFCAARFLAARLSAARFSVQPILLLFVGFACTSANAIVLRGRVTDALGKAVPGGRVQLVYAGKVEAIAYADATGAYELRYANGGRFTLLGSAVGFLPSIGQDFYGSADDVFEKDIVLSSNTLNQEVSVTATGIPTPLPQLTVPVTEIPGQYLTTRVGVTDELRQVPGAFFVQTGQAGGVTSLFLRGAQSDANKILIDGIPAEDVGGRFDFGTVSSTGVAAMEIDRGPDSALYGSDSLGGVVSFVTPRGSTLRPLLAYSGDAGNLHSYRNEVALSGAYQKLDYLGAFSRFQTANALPNDEYHSATSSGNVGYALPYNTFVRGTIRNAVSASGVPNAHDFYGVSANAKQGDQDIYAGGTLENTTKDQWHNLVRYGIARKREEFTTFSPVGTEVGSGPYATYYGDVETIRGANGYKAIGAAAIAYAGTYPASYLLVSDRDELYYQSDKTFTNHLIGLFGFRYENERGAYDYPIYGTSQSLQRTNFEYNGQFQGDIKSRVFYSLGGAIEKNHLYGVRGTPRLGLAWQAVRPGRGLMRGTRLRFNVSRGVQEPNLSAQFGSLYAELLPGNTAAIAAYGVTPIKAEEARTYDYGIDQNIFGSRVVLKAGYFHSQFDHQIEYVNSTALKTYFGLNTIPSGVYGAYENSLTYRAQGMESELQYQARTHLFFRGGYTYLAPLVERSFSSDALRVYGSTTNPNLPGITIGSTSPLVGQRPFRRAPNTGFLSAHRRGVPWSLRQQVR